MNMGIIFKNMQRLMKLSEYFLFKNHGMTMGQ